MCPTEALSFNQMTVLAQLPEIIGFFSYSREDDLDSDGALSTLRKRIQSELRAQLGRSEKSLRLFQDAEAIAPGMLWETKLGDAILKCSFFIPIVTPRVVHSKYCRLEFESFLERERAVGRSDLIFPIIYIEIPELKDETYWRADPVLNCIGQRQYVDWSDHRFELDTPRVRREIAVFARTIVYALKRETGDWLGEESFSKEAGSKQPRPEAERITHERQARGRQEEAHSRTRAQGRDDAPTRAAAEEKTLPEPGVDQALTQAPAGDEQIASKPQPEHAPEQTNRTRFIALFMGATATILIAIIGLSYALLGPGQDRSGTWSKEARQDNSAPKAYAAYERAAEAGDTEAMIRLGSIYQNGRDVRQDYDKAKQYYRKAADLGDADALNYLGRLYENGMGMTRDYNQARSLYEKAADAGDANGLRNLGLLYALGRGVSQDYDRARSFFERAKPLYQEAADKGNPAGMTNLGWLYDGGRGVGVDYNKARSLYEKAALGGDAQAMNNLGQMYENARGVWRDYSKAKGLYEQAAGAGNEDATLNLERLKDLDKPNEAK